MMCTNFIEAGEQIQTELVMEPRVFSVGGGGGGGGGGAALAYAKIYCSYNILQYIVYNILYCSS